MQEQFQWIFIKLLFHAGKHFLKVIIQEGEKVEEEELPQDNSAVTSPVAPMKKRVPKLF